MIVAGILGLLAVIAVPRFVNARRSTRVEQARADLAILAAGVKELAWDTGMWPGGVERTHKDKEVWDLTGPDAGLLSAWSVFRNWQGAYVPDIHLDPWGSPYFFDSDYRVGNVNHVVVGSFGPNRIGRNVYDSDDVFVIIE
jgi:type II secretory pathway pseudopilin PulG